MRTGLSLISVLMSAGALGAELPRAAAEGALASLIAIRESRKANAAIVGGNYARKDV